MDPTIAAPWWKHRWPWILMSGPLVAMLACLATLWLALDHPDPPVREGVVKQGLKVTEQPRP